VGLKTVKSVEAGKVIHQGRLPSFGKVLMIDHGGKNDKIISVYGNLDSIMVGVGQWVRRGDPVALIGQGAETQLHLEIRKNAEPSDPLAWLER
jgi:septal ring factor EnvC (AmiA/AmiB activator)